LPLVLHVEYKTPAHDDANVTGARYGKPVVWDEEEYEGDIPPGWGRLTGQQMADRCVFPGTKIS
jgi:hypothetical protein